MQKAEPLKCLALTTGWLLYYIKGVKYSSKTEEILRRCLACMYTGVRHSKLNSDNGTLIVSLGIDIRDYVNGIGNCSREQYVCIERWGWNSIFAVYV